MEDVPLARGRGRAEAPETRGDARVLRGETQKGGHPAAPVPG